MGSLIALDSSFHTRLLRFDMYTLGTIVGECCYALFNQNERFSL